MTNTKKYFEDILIREGNKLRCEYGIDDDYARFIIGNLISHAEMGDYRNYFTKLFEGKEKWETVAVNAHLKHIRFCIMNAIHKIGY